MKITFNGDSVSDLVYQCKNFSAAFSQTTPPMFSQENLRPEKTYSGPNNSVTPTNGEKRPPGRPVESPEKKAAKNAKLLKEVAQTSKMVGPPGFEPGASELTQDKPLAPQDSTDFMGEELESPTPAKKIAKTDLEAVLRKLYEKENLAAGNNKAGMDKVKGVYAQFGIPHLKELDEKRYHEMYALVEGLLS